MVPESDHKRLRSNKLTEPNSLFFCGHYEFNGDIIMIYSGGDTVIPAVRVKKADTFGKSGKIK
jgi:hypothetical protein